MGSRKSRIGFSTLMAGMALLFALPVAAQSVCNAPRDLVRLAVPLEAAQRAMYRERSVRIIALGSSSTEGAGASSPKMCYPARLEAELNRRYGEDAHFEVVNLGAGGELAENMLARLDRDVISRKPSLVIWQTGVNDVIRGVPLDEFRTSLVQGIDAIAAAGADLMLLDSQYYPKAMMVPGFREYLVTMRQVAREKGVPIVSRFAIMKHLVDSAQYTPAQLLAPDQFHLNDLSYNCLGSILADAIGDGLKRPRSSADASGAGAAQR